MPRWIFTFCFLLLSISSNAEAAFQIDALPNGGFRLTSTTQPFAVDVTENGALFVGSGNHDGKDSFSLSLLQLGREGKLQAITSSRIHAENNAVYHEYSLALEAGGMSEKFSKALDESIQQTFSLSVKLQGVGLLHLQLQVRGATANTRAGGAVIVLGSGRHLAIDRLIVTDAVGNKIPAHVMVAKNNILDIVVDDTKAGYPITIHPVLDELSVVNVPGSAVSKTDGRATTVMVPNTQIEKRTNIMYDDDEAHTTVKPPPEIIKAVEELRKPAPGDGEEIHHADGSVSIKLGNRFSSVPIATTDPDGKVHVDYHGEAYVTGAPVQTSSQSTQSQKEITGDNKP